MARINENELKKMIKSDEIKPVYYLCGDEKYLIKHYYKMLQEKISGKEPSEFSFHIFSGDTDIEQIAVAANSIPFMGGKNFIGVEDLDANRLTDSEHKKWLELIGNLSEDSVLVICQLTVNPDHSKSKAKKLITEIEKNGIVADISKRGDIALEKQLVSWAAKAGKSLQAVDAARIITYCGTDLYTLKNELDKLCAYSQDNTITRQAIDALVIKNIEVRVFDLAKLVTSGNTDKAYSLLDNLLYQREEPVTLLAILSSAYVDMYRARVAIESGKRAVDAADDFDYKRKEFRLKNAEKASSQMTTDSIRKCIDILADTEKKMKSSGADKEILLQKLIAELVLAAKKG